MLVLSFIWLVYLHLNPSGAPDLRLLEAPELSSDNFYR